MTIIMLMLILILSSDDDCNYRLKIIENKELLKSLTSQILINNFKNLDISTVNSNETGACKLIEYGAHIKKHNEMKIDTFLNAIQGRFLL